MGTILIGGKRYELIVDHKNGWNPSAFRDRYSDVLERYDFIIGDWGYNQLRLKGFFKDNNPKGSKDSYISGLVDYINEYCNFGCAYFVIQRHETAEIDGEASNEPDLLLSPPQSSESGAEEGVVALNENGEPIVLREHIRKPHPVRKEQSARPDRTDGRDGGGNRYGSGKQAPQRKEGRISSEEQRDSDNRWGSGERRGSDQPRGGGERRGSDQQRSSGERRGGDQQRSSGSERRGGDQPRGGGERRGGDQPRGGGERRGGDQPRSGGERRGGDQPRGGSEQRGGDQPRSGSEQRGGDKQPRGGNERQQRGGEQQPRGGSERRGGDQPPRSGGERREGDQPREAGEPHAESRRQTRFKQRKGQKKLPMPPREQTVAATSESALEGAGRPHGGGENG